MNRQKDEAYMSMAFALAEKARGRTSPNPMVGAVIVKNDRIVGWGYHEQAGKPHAEIIALKHAADKVRGATLYVTLEPCVHYGRTPPCIDRLLQSGLSRIVIASRDPNPLVDGQGIKRLRQAGLSVTTGILEHLNQKLNEAHIKYITKKMPFVTLKAAASLDGKIASATGDSRWISSPASREYAHFLREENDAVMVGSGTVIKDDPLLTVRHGRRPGKKIARVIIDSRLRIPLSARLLRAPLGGPVIIFTGANAPEFKVRALARDAVEVVTDGRNERFGLERVLRELGRREISSVLVEGGSALLSSFLDQKLADKAVIFLAPRLIGGRSSPGLFGGRGADKIADGLQLKKPAYFNLEGDIIIEGYF